MEDQTQDFTGQTGTEDAQIEDSSTSETETSTGEEQAGTPTAETAGTPEAEDESKVPAWAKKRFDKLTQQRYEAEREAAYLRGQLEAGKKPEQATEAGPVEDPQPTPDKFQSYDDYVRAVGRWEARQEFKSLREQERKDTEAKEAKKREESAQKTFHERVNSYRSTVPDYDAVVSTLPPLGNKGMVDAVLESDMGPQIAYHLAKNSAEAARIAQLSPIAAIREIGKLEAKLTPSAAAQKPTNTISAAPPPPATVNGNSGGAQKDPSKMTDDEWFAWDKAEKTKKLQARSK